MTRSILILGASYGSLLGTKLLMAGQDVTLVCRRETAALINAEGTEVRLKLRGESAHRAISSGDCPGQLAAVSPDEACPSDHDLIVLAMSEPQYGAPDITELLGRVAASGKPCLSLMNMPPPPFLARVRGLDVGKLAEAFAAPDIWHGFQPGKVTLCSPDPQAYRLPDAPANVLQVGLPTNFKSAPFEDAEDTAMLRELESAIEAVRLDGQEVPVKLRTHDSLFVPFAKWSMLLTGNYRCVLSDGVQPIAEAVLGDLDASRAIYDRVSEIVLKLGGEPEDLVPFEKYAKAAEGLTKPSSAARAIAAGATAIERVDLLVQLIAMQLGLGDPAIDQVTSTVSARLRANQTPIS